MKKAVSLFLALVCILCMISSCASSTNPNDADPDNGGGGALPGEDVGSTSNTSPKEKFSGRITRGTCFSEGLAIVTDGTKTYCLNTKGEIVFTLDFEYEDGSAGLYNPGFHGGIIQLGDCFYTKTGEEIKPEDVGVTKFYDYALPAGYIVALKEESTYNTSKKMLGILNTEFEWIIPLSEELYQKASKLCSATIYAYAIDGYIIDRNANFVFELSSETMYTFENAPNAMGEHGWTVSGDGSFRKGESNIKLMVEGGRPVGEWVNGKHIIKFYNSEARKTYFTVVNTKGEFEFEPVELTTLDDYYVGCAWNYDGRYIFVKEQYGESRIFIYDTVLKTTTVSSQSFSLGTGTVRIHDGIVCIHAVDAYTKNVMYYDMAFQRLFV